MTANRFKDLQIASAPFSYIELKTWNRKNVRCHISKEKIEKGEEVYCFKLFNYDQDIEFYAKKNLFESSDYYKNYTEKFLKNKYSISDFYNNDSLFHPDYLDAIHNFSIEKAINLIIHPTTLPTRYQYRDDVNHNNGMNKGNDLLLEEEKLYAIKSIANVVPLLLSILIKCGYSNHLLDNLHQYPKDSLMLFALLDNLQFQNKIAQILNVKELPEILNIFREKIMVSDIKSIIKFGRKHPEFISLLSESLDKYELHYLNTLDVPDCFRNIAPPKNCQIVYLFIAYPKLLPVFQRLLDKGDFPMGGFYTFTYMECYYYRSALFYIAEHDPDHLQSWIENMKTRIQYFHTGSPKGFINDSIKMVKQYTTDRFWLK